LPEEPRRQSSGEKKGRKNVPINVQAGIRTKVKSKGPGKRWNCRGETCGTSINDARYGKKETREATAAPCANDGPQKKEKKVGTI